MKFGIPQLLRFQAVQGAYSPITDREIYDSQLTATDAEAELLEDFFGRRGQSIYTGNVNSNPSAAVKSFRLFPSGKTIHLNLVYPKPGKNELRLYLAKKRGFFPQEGDIWFLFVTKDDELWIGHLQEKAWRSLFSEESTDPIIPATPLPPPTMEIPVQDPNLIRKRMELSKYRCEYNPEHRLFVARATGCRYVEVHHVIPKKYQKTFFLERQKDLTRLDNLCSLCPWCHRAIHHGEEALSRDILSKLFDIRSVGFHYGISKAELFQLYSVEEIVKME